MTAKSSKIVVLILLFAFIFNNSVFAAKKKKKNTAESGISKSTYQKQEKTTAAEGDGAAADAEEQTSVDLSTGTVKLPSQKRTYFSKIDSQILADVENGSPESLRQAMAKLRKNESDYEEPEKVLIAVSTEIMKTLWPSETVTWETFDVSSENPYIGAIESAQKGIFDTSTGNTDFLTIILPAVVLLKPASNSSVYADCETALKTAVSVKPDSVFANYLSGVLQEKLQNYQLAQQFYKKAYDFSPQTSEISLAYVKVLRQNGNLELASKIMNDMSATGNDSVELLKQKAYLAFAAKDYDGAEQYVAKVLQQTPNNLEFVLLRAKILIEKNDYIHAVSLLDVYARQDDSNLDYLLLRVKVQLDWSKNTSAATETVEKILQLYPENPDALMFAARISSLTDSPVAGLYADDLAAKVLQNNPDNENALTYALEGLIQRENWTEAYEISSKLIQLPSISSDVINRHVVVCVQLGKRAEAYDFAKKMQEKFPADENVLQSYILAYSKYGNRDVVMKYIDQLLPSASSKMKSYLYYTRSSLQLTEENTLADLRSALISNPRNSDALFYMYEIYYKKQDYRKAQYYLRQVVAINPNDSSVKKLNEALTKLIN